jgi:uncharacterized protein (TIGR03086 family)
MSEFLVLDRSHEILREVVANLTAADLGLPSPCERWTVAQVLQHAAGDQVGYASKLTGGPGPSYDPFAPSGTLDGKPMDLLAPALEASASAWATVEPGSEVTTPLPVGPLSAEIGAACCALDAAVHAWDIAKATGQPSPLTPELARALMPAAKVTDPLREYGVYAPIVDAEPGDDDVAVLLRFLGRRP